MTATSASVRFSAAGVTGVDAFVRLTGQSFIQCCVYDDIAPELSVPRYISPLQAFRVLTPPLYRWGVRKGRDMGLKGTKATDG